jgi:hypothetical protein
MNNPTTESINQAAAAFEAHVGYAPERIASAAVPCGWLYFSNAVQRAFWQWCSGRPAKRYENVHGFDDADYVEFVQGAEFGFGVKDGVAYPMPYERDCAEGFVERGLWREVLVPAAAPASGPVTFTAGDETLLDQLRAWEAEPAGLGAGKLYDAAIAHIDARVAAHVAEKLEHLRARIRHLERELDRALRTQQRTTQEGK